MGYQFDVKLGDYANLAAVIATGTPSSVAFSDIQDNKVFVLEKVEKRIYSYMGYTSDFRNVASVMDARQKRVSYAYDSDNRLLTKMTDANNHSTQYHYEASTDRLTGVSATASGQTRDVSYTYDEGDRIKSIKHGGTTYAFDYDGFGNQTMVKAGDKTLESYGYAPNNGPLITVAYGNGDTQEILYDKEERIRARRWNGESTDAVRYEYDDYGTLEKETDLVNGRIDKDQYDMTGRLVQSTTLEKNTGAAGEPTVANTHTVQSLEIGYDSYNRVNRLVQSLEGSKTKTGLVYGDASKAQRPGLSYGLTVDGTQRQSLAYDAMARCTKETVTLPGGQKRENCFTYGTLRHLTDTDSLLSAMSNGTESWSYEYDNVGNITKITSGTKVITYQYDELNQLIRENNGVLGTTVLYTYDAGGNMTSRKTYAYTEGTPQTLQKNETLSYRTDGWKDQLVSWNGYRYVYDAGGNPTLLRGVPLTWGEGRRLKRVSLSWGTVDFAYDSDGKRVRKTSGGNTTTYYYNGNVLSGLVRKASKDAGTTGTGTTVQFVYDTQGKPFMLRLNGKTDYFYLYNGLGDVVGLVDSSNQVVVRYQYNSWGKVTSTQDTSGVSLATLNPFRYRKYVYDPETGLYCLGSRYYDPEVGRFVNADRIKFAVTLGRYYVNRQNLYQYCFNNPIMLNDKFGSWPKLPEWLDDLGKSAKKAAKAIGTAITKTVQAMQLSVGGGLGIGFTQKAEWKDTSLNIGALASEKMIIEITKDGLDIKNIISVQLTGGVGNSTVGYEYGRVHSYRACKVHHDPVMTPFGTLFECPYSTEINEPSAKYGIGGSLYMILGGEVFFGVNIEEVLQVWLEAIDDAFTVECY